jgi:hypothetical protein
LIYFRAISSAMLSIQAGDNARDVIACARRSVGTDCRPTELDLAKILKQG